MVGFGRTLRQTLLTLLTESCISGELDFCLLLEAELQFSIVTRLNRLRACSGAVMMVVRPDRAVWRANAQRLVGYTPNGEMKLLPLSRYWL